MSSSGRSVYAQSLTSAEKTMNLSTFGYLFSELVSYHHSSITSVSDLETRYISWCRKCDLLSFCSWNPNFSLQAQEVRNPRRSSALRTNFHQKKAFSTGSYCAWNSSVHFGHGLDISVWKECWRTGKEYRTSQCMWVGKSDSFVHQLHMELQFLHRWFSLFRYDSWEWAHY